MFSTVKDAKNLTKWSFSEFVMIFLRKNKICPIIIPCIHLLMNENKRKNERNHLLYIFTELLDLYFLCAKERASERELGGGENRIISLKFCKLENIFQLFVHE